MQRLAMEKTRLNIPLLLGLDVIHGHRTMFPDSPGRSGSVRSGPVGSDRRARRRRRPPPMACTSPSRPCWMWRAIRAGAASPKAPAKTLFVGEVMARAKVKGFQGAGLADPTSLAACAKHYCAYGAVTAGREYAPTEISAAQLERNLSAALPGGSGGRRRQHHAGLHRYRRRADERASRPAHRLSARRAGLQGRGDQRLQRHCRIDPSRRGRRSGGSGGAGAESRRRYRHDGECLSRRPAGGAEPRPGYHGRYRCRRARAC